MLQGTRRTKKKSTNNYNAQLEKTKGDSKRHEATSQEIDVLQEFYRRFTLRNS